MESTQRAHFANESDSLLRYAAQVELNINNRLTVGGYERAKEYPKIFKVIENALKYDFQKTEDSKVIKKLEKIKTNIDNDDYCSLYESEATDNYMEAAVKKTVKLMDRISNPELDELLLSSNNVVSRLEEDRSLLRKIDPSVLAKYIDKIPANFLLSEKQYILGFPRLYSPGSGLTKDQIDAIPVSKLRADQLLAIGLLNLPVVRIFSLDLSRFDRAMIRELMFSMEKFQVRYFDPRTIAANVYQIDTHFYTYFSDDQLKAIDYATLSDQIRRCFCKDSLAKMKNYQGEMPRPVYNARSRPLYNPADFTNYNANVRDFWKNHRNKVQDDAELNQEYKALRSRVLQFNTFMEPRLVFDADAGTVTRDNVKKLYNKLALVTHPDRHKVERQEEAGALFTILGSALKLLT